MNRWLLMLGVLFWLGITVSAEDEFDAANPEEPSLTLTIEPLFPPRDDPHWHRSLVDGHSWIGAAANPDEKVERPAGEFMVKPLKELLASKWYGTSNWDQRYEPMLLISHDPVGVDPLFLRAVDAAINIEKWTKRPRDGSLSSRLLGENLFYNVVDTADWR